MLSGSSVEPDSTNVVNQAINTAQGKASGGVGQVEILTLTFYVDGFKSVSALFTPFLEGVSERSERGGCGLSV